MCGTVTVSATVMTDNPERNQWHVSVRIQHDETQTIIKSDEAFFRFFATNFFH